jgi:peptidoglycan hydrolase-like protein with peptidoglycan-binding domain
MEPPTEHRNGSHGSGAPPTLYPWDTGAAVARMQELLRAHGYVLRIDGDFGWRTEVAVKQFQRQSSIKVDGIVGPETWSMLVSTVKPGTRLLRQGCSGADVYELQGLLQVNGYPIRRNGIFNAETKAAVVEFQQTHHLQPSGQVDAVTWSLLSGKKTSARPVTSRFNLLRRRRSSRS